MSGCNQAFDTHGELLIQRYGDGISLVKPDSCADHTKIASPVFITSPFHLLIDTSSHFIDSILTPLQKLAEILSVKSAALPHLIIAPENLVRNFCDQSIYFRGKVSRICEETGYRVDVILFNVSH